MNVVCSKNPQQLVFINDISRHKRTEELLHQNQDLLRILSQLAPLAMGSVTVNGDCIYVTEGWRTISGRSEEAALGVGWIECVHPDDYERVSVLWRQAIQAGTTFEAEYRLSLPDGGFKWVHCQCVPEKSAQGEVLGYAGLIIDITQRMNERDQLERLVHERTEQLLSMIVELTTTEERERQALSQELHDGLAQRLAVAKLKLSARVLDKNCHGLHCGLIREMETLVDEANEVVRSLSLQLSPPMLYEFGLMSALEWLADEMYRSYGLSVIVSGEGVPVAMDHTVLNQIFRATRELLINVGKHAQTDMADVIANCENGCLTISVMDAGVGFDPKLRITVSAKGGYGLFSVRQRMTCIGGDVQIDSRPGDGSLIVLSVPLESSQ